MWIGNKSSRSYLQPFHKLEEKWIPYNTWKHIIDFEESIVGVGSKNKNNKIKK